MNESDEYNISLLLEACDKMIFGEIHLVEGVRIAHSMLTRLGLGHEEEFLIFKAIDSSTDHWPSFAIRENFNTAFLEEVDGETNSYIEKMQPQLIKICHEVMNRFRENEQ